MNKYKSFSKVHLPFYSLVFLLSLQLTFIYSLSFLYFCYFFLTHFLSFSSFLFIYAGRYTNDSKKIHQIQEQPTHRGSDEETTTTVMLETNYQYTPLKEYAAMRNDPTTINTTTTTNSYQSIGIGDK